MLNSCQTANWHVNLLRIQLRVVFVSVLNKLHELMICEYTVCLIASIDELGGPLYASLTQTAYSSLQLTEVQKNGSTEFELEMSSDFKGHLSTSLIASCICVCAALAIR